MKKKIIYEENPWDDDPIVGDIIPDFLPKPWELAAMEKKSRVTIMLEDSSVKFFKKQAKKYGVSYQAMIRNLLRDYSQKASSKTA